MALLEKLFELSKALLNANEELSRLREMTRDVGREIDSVVKEIQEIRERLARLEASRQADHAKMAAEISLFKTEIERAAMRQDRLLLRAAKSADPKEDEK